MVGDIERAFSRQGSEIHLSELRAGVLPLHVTLPVAFVSGFLLSLFPWALGIFLRLILAVTSQGNAVEAPFSLKTPHSCPSWQRYGRTVWRSEQRV